MRDISNTRVAPFAVCGDICACLAFIGIASRNLYVTPAQSAVGPALLIFVGCGLIAWFVRDRARAWRWLWLAASALSVIGVSQVYLAFLGTPSEMIPQTRGENAPGFAMFGLMTDLVIGLGGPALLLLFAATALLLSWQLGRQQE